MPQPAGTTRFASNIGEITAEQLQSLKQSKGTNTTTTIERAVVLLGWFEDTLSNGGVIKVSDPNGDVREIVFI